MPIKKEVLDELLKGSDPKKLFSCDGLLDELTKALAERALNAEIERHFFPETQVQTCVVHLNRNSPAIAAARRRNWEQMIREVADTPPPTNRLRSQYSWYCAT